MDYHAPNPFVKRGMTVLYLRKGRKLYAAFMDLEIVYDTVDREALWSILTVSSVGGWIVEGIKAFYRGVKGGLHERNFGHFLLPAPSLGSIDKGSSTRMLFTRTQPMLLILFALPWSRYWLCLQSGSWVNIYYYTQLTMTNENIFFWSFFVCFE